MTPRATVLIVFVVFALTVPGVVGSGFAAPIPDYFKDEWVGFVCLTASPPGSPPISVLVQFNFDQVTFGGISLIRANSLFTFLTSNLGLLSPTIGNNPQTTCSLTPSQTLAMFPGATALQAAQQVSGSFQQLGFPPYIPDVDMLLYAHVSGFAEHAKARRWWEGLLNGDTEVAIAAPALFGFIRLATSPRVFNRPFSIGDVLGRVEAWFSRPHVRFALPGPRYLEIAFDLLRELGAAGGLTTDVQLAALAIEHQGEVHSNDADFSRFRRLRWVNPLR